MLNFNTLILLVGTNPLPNFVVAEYFLQNNSNIHSIWLIHSAENSLQAGTAKQARNLEALLQKRWGKKHENLQMPFEKISISDVSDAKTIRNEIENKLVKKLNDSTQLHLNYTGGTKAMANHVYLCLRELQLKKTSQFSYLDGNNFRLIDDDNGVIGNDLRQQVEIDLTELITLHGFKRCNQDKDIDFGRAKEMFQKFIDPNCKQQIDDGYWLEEYIAYVLNDKFKDQLNSKEGVLHNWLIKKTDWRTNFELDVLMLHGYHFTGISCTIGYKKDSCKSKGFEIALRSRQIGGNNAKAILITGSNKTQTIMLQEELKIETGESLANILVLGIEDLRNESIYLSKIEDFIFG